MPYTPYVYTSPDDPARDDDGLFAHRNRPRRHSEPGRRTQQRVLLGAIRAMQRAESAGDDPGS